MRREKPRAVKIPRITRLPSGAWHCQLRLTGADGRTRSVSITDSDYAVVEAKAIAVKAGILDHSPRLRSSLTLQQAVEKYIGDRRNILSPSTLRGYTIIKNNRFQAYMHRRLDALPESVCRRMVNEEARLCSPKTLKNAWGFVSSVLAAELGVHYNVPLPQVPPSPRAFLDADQIPVLVSAVKGSPVEIPALLALHSLRLSEILGLTWDKIDLSRGVVTVSASMVPDEHNTLVYKKVTKNRSSTRSVPIMIPELSAALSAVEVKSGPVVSLKPACIRAELLRVCEEAGLPRVTPHGLRHSFASLAYHLGLPEKITMQLGGWSDDATMKKIYTHIADKDLSGAAELMSGFYGSSDDASPAEINDDFVSISVSI